jgi:NAD(P)-dependent dehydrogenase (short-subunit alcohol dehydrogenase family)
MGTCNRRHVVVTGPSSGIGRATAERLARRGYHVFAAMRDPADVPNDTTQLRFDVTDARQVAAAAGVVERHVGAPGLDGLANIAGVGVSWPLELIPLDEVRRQLEVNVVGQLAVTQAFLPMLRAARGRIVMIGSIGARIAVPFAGPLAASNSALGTVTAALRQELAPWGIHVVLVEPATMLPPERAGSPPDVVADTIATALHSRRPRARYRVGRDTRKLAGLAQLLPTPGLDAVRRRLFQLPVPDSRL